MKTTIAAMVLAIAVTVLAQQTRTLDTLRWSYEKEQQSILVQYGTALNTIISDLKEKGDLDNFLIAQTEQKRFIAENTGPAPTTATDSFRPAFEAYSQAMVALLGPYVTALDGLIKKEMAADQIAEAKLVKVEKDKASILLAQLRAKLPEPAAVEKPATDKFKKPVVARSLVKPQTYVDETRGWAGMESKGNVYTFQLDAVGKNAIFRFWASGDIGTSTSGQVLLTGPDAMEHVIRQWKPSDFKVAANTVSSYKKLKPISCDISTHVKQPGQYQFTFRWGGRSQFGLSILRVELELQ